MHTLSTAQLAGLLRASAAGFYADEAAVQLVMRAPQPAWPGRLPR